MGLSHRAPTHKLTAAQPCSQRSGCSPGRPPTGVAVTATAAATAGSALFVTRPRPLPAHTPRGNGCQVRRRLWQKGAAGTLRRRRQQQVWAHRPPSSGTGGFGTGASPGQVAAKVPFGLHHHLPGRWGAGGVPVTGGGRAQQVVAGARGGGGSMGAGEREGRGMRPTLTLLLLLWWCPGLAWPSCPLLHHLSRSLPCSPLPQHVAPMRPEGRSLEGRGSGWLAALSPLTPGASTDTWPHRPPQVPTPYTALPSSTTASPPHPHPHHTRRTPAGPTSSRVLMDRCWGMMW